MIIKDDLEAFGKKLIQSQLLTAEQVAEASLKASEKGTDFLQDLIQASLLTKNAAYEALAEFYGTPFVDLSNFQVSSDAIQAIPSDLAHRFKVVPIFKIGNTLNVVMENPTDVSAIDQLKQKTQCEIDVCLGAPQDIQKALQEHYGISNTLAQLLDSLSQERSSKSRFSDDKKIKLKSGVKADFMSAASEPRPVIPLVDMIFQQAYEQGASDIHAEPEEKVFRIRYRIDGVLQEALLPPKDLESEIISRIKILAGMDIAENRIPQDGRIKLNLQGKTLDMRVSTMPTVYGENIVLRLLKDSHEVLDLPSLGLSKEMQDVFESLIRRPYGMILETGPTGSGKTTTLYAALQTINSLERNIITIEDPVEYKLAMLRQVPVNPKAGLTFATALRSILRQDPDVIMVGEIRDKETAEIAIQAALTGHLVFSTLHTNNAANAVTRLVDMKIEPFLVASSVIGVIAQRLVRKICLKCKQEDVPPSAMTLEALKIQAGKIPMFKGKGCRQCHQTGYKGRIGIYEILKVNELIQKKIVNNASPSEIEDVARQGGQNSIREDALEKIAAGLTTAEEVIKAIV